MLQVQMSDNEIFTRLPFDTANNAHTQERYHDDIYLADFLKKFNAHNDPFKRRLSQNIFHFSELTPSASQVRVSSKLLLNILSDTFFATFATIFASFQSFFK
jgi:hypothetical protein